MQTISARPPGLDLSRFLLNSLHRRSSAVTGLDDLSDSAIDWFATVRRANDNLVGPALWTAIVRAQVLDRLPMDVRQYLKLLHNENARCNEAIRAQCARIGGVLAQAGVHAVLLK